MRDRVTHQPVLTGFTALSRRYNNMFCLAQHEIQCADGLKEVRFGGPQRPANIRIHGTIYRKVFAASDAAPLRYLIIDPKARLEVGKVQGPEKRTMQELERVLMPENEHFCKRKTIVFSAAWR